MEKWDVVVVGGGPSGIMAAGRAAERGRRVLLVERNRALGSKLLLSGKGRCNLTNTKETGPFIEEFGPSGKFLYNAFSRFFNKDLVAFFEKRGLALKAERGGRVFPVSDDAGDILKTLQVYLSEQGVIILRDTMVEDVMVASNSVTGVKSKSGRKIGASKVVLATGGLSYPATGSTGKGHEISKKLGHAIVPPRAALVPVETEERYVKEWQGISLKNVECAVYADEKKRASMFGEMLFTHHGLSGPIILDLSKLAGEELIRGRDVAISINFKPALDREKLEARLLREFAAAPKKTLRNVFKELLPKNLIGRFLEISGVSGEKAANQITKEDRVHLIRALTDFRLKVKKIRPVEEAIVTAGGVATREVDPKTMESRLIKGLYIVGELLDVDAGTGGYNLQAAFSTGYVCGDNI